MNVARNEQSEGGEVLVLQRRRRETGPGLHRAGQEQIPLSA